MKVLKWIRLLLLAIVLYGVVCVNFVTSDVLEPSQVTHNNVDQQLYKKFRKLGEVHMVERRVGPVPVPSPPLPDKTHVWIFATPPPPPPA
ncbi:hypothetical protein RND81_01G105100 [Saponaria officinalis]|uniref:Uncharacterized protein n=1 Tax=Saponaria officinalis TaxID=3572 RepID=A0AAW1NHY2_SAPOF